MNSYMKKENKKSQEKGKINYYFFMIGLRREGIKSGKFVLFFHYYQIAQSAGAVVDADCISIEGYNPSSQQVSWWH